MIEGGRPERQMERLRAIVHRLRAPGGCPWDAEQTHASLVPNLIEEAYEVIDAIERQDWPHLREELGDLLLQVVFHAELAAEEGRFDFDAVAREVSDKLVRRHPHVFGDGAAADATAVLAQWEAIKRREKSAEAAGWLDGVGRGLPALLRAVKLQKKAAKVGFDWPTEAGVMAKIHEELDELARAEEADHAAEELGDVLFSVVNLARYRGLDPEAVLARANEKFQRRFGLMEARLRDDGRELGEASLDELEASWQAVKEAPGAGAGQAR